MLVKNKTKTIEFEEQDEGFIKQLAKDIGCYYCKANERTYNLNKFDSTVLSEMGVFAWVHKEDINCFWVTTRKIWIEEAKTKSLNHKNTAVISCFPKDTRLAEDSVSLDTQDDYHKTVSTLKLVNLIR